VDVGESALLVLLDDPLPLDGERETLVLEHRGDGRRVVGEDVDVNIRALADVARVRAADQLRAEGAEQPHHVEGGDAHLSEVFLAFFSLVEVGQGLDLVADFAVGGEVFGAKGAARPRDTENARAVPQQSYIRPRPVRPETKI